MLLVNKPGLPFIINRLIFMELNNLTLLPFLKGIISRIHPFWVIQKYKNYLFLPDIIDNSASITLRWLILGQPRGMACKGNSFKCFG